MVSECFREVCSASQPCLSNSMLMPQHHEKRRQNKYSGIKPSNCFDCHHLSFTQTGLSSIVTDRLLPVHKTPRRSPSNNVTFIFYFFITWNQISIHELVCTKLMTSHVNSKKIFLKGFCFSFGFPFSLPTNQQKQHCFYEVSSSPCSFLKKL